MENYMIWSNIRIDLSKMTVVFPEIVYAGNTTRNPDPEYHSARSHKLKIWNCQRAGDRQWEVRYAPKCYVQFSMSLRPVWSKAVAALCTGCMEFLDIEYRMQA